MLMVIAPELLRGSSRQTVSPAFGGKRADDGERADKTHPARSPGVQATQLRSCLSGEAGQHVTGFETGLREEPRPLVDTMQVRDRSSVPATWGRAGTKPMLAQLPKSGHLSKGLS